MRAVRSFTLFRGHIGKFLDFVASVGDKLSVNCSVLI